MGNKGGTRSRRNLLVDSSSNRLSSPSLISTYHYYGDLEGLAAWPDPSNSRARVWHATEDFFHKVPENSQNIFSIHEDGGSGG